MGVSDIKYLFHGSTTIINSAVTRLEENMSNIGPHTEKVKAEVKFDKSQEFNL